MSAPEPPPSKKPRRRRLRTFLLCTLGTLALIILPALAYRQYFVWQAERRLAELEAELDANDPGWRFEEILAARKRIPNEENSIPAIMAAAKLIPPKWPVVPAAQPLATGENAEKTFIELWKRVAQPEPNQLLCPELARELERELVVLAPAIQAGRELRREPVRGDAKLQYAKNPLATVIPQIDAVSNLVKLLRLDVALCNQRESTNQALESSVAILRCSQSIADDPMFIALLVRSFALNHMTWSLEETLGHDNVDANRLAELQDMLAKEADGLDRQFVDCARMERAVVHHLFGLVASGELSLESLRTQTGSPPKGLDRPYHWLAEGPRFRHLQGMSLTLMEPWIVLTRTPPEQQLELGKKLNSDFKAAMTTAPSWTKFVYGTPPATDKIAHAVNKARANLHSCNVALACERYRLKHDDWPNIIEDLIPEYLDKVPQDCFRKAPLNFRRLPDGVVIYSVGPDGEDDGGLIIRGERPPPKERGVPSNEDIGFRLWSPNARRQPPPLKEAPP